MATTIKKKKKTRKPSREMSPAKLAYKKKAFLEAYRKLGTISHSCRLIGVNRSLPSKWMREDKEFEKACWIAEQDGVDNLEVEARRRALKHSDTLLIFLLKSKRPEIFGDKLKVAFETSTLSKFCERVIETLNAAIPRTCPHCKTNLNLNDSLAQEMLRVSQEFKDKTTK